MKYSKVVGGITIQIDTKRIDNNIREAQKKLNMQVVADCDEYIPMQQGALRGSANYPKGIYGDEISWNTPYAHYQYMGELYLAENGSSWAQKYEKKYPTGQPLTYHAPGTDARWFERAKDVHKNEWINLVKREVGKN